MKNWVARWLASRLRGVQPDVLAQIKSELTTFNARTGRWIERRAVREKADE